MHHSLAESSARRKRCRLQLQSLRKQFVAEVFVPAERNILKTEASAQSDLISDYAFAALRVLARTPLHVCVKISFSLIVIADVSPPFLQQILIHRSFGV